MVFRTRSTSVKPTRSRASSNGHVETADVRAWARSKGIQVNERGRISADVVAKYEAAH
jgi:ABC-type Fe3+-citrate transport system substrate-binding protein